MARYPGNFTDSDILNVPRQLRTRPGNPQVELAYVTPKEQGILQALKPGTPHKGPMGVPNYDEDDYFFGDWKPVTSSGVSSSVSQGPSQAVEDEYDEPDPKYEAQTQADINKIIDRMKDKGQYTATPGPAEGTGAIQAGKDIVTKIAGDFSNLIPGIAGDWSKSGGLWGIPIAFAKKLAHPTKESFQNPNFMATLNKLFEDKKKELGEEAGEQFKKDYVRDYKELISEALGSPMDEEEAFYNFEDSLKESYERAVAGDLGKSVQEIIDPTEFYTGSGARLSKGKIVMPQTTGGLENLAGLATTGPNAITDPKLRQMIFDARNQVGTEKLRQEQAGQSQSYRTPDPGIYTPPLDPSDPTPDPDPDPDLTLPPGTTPTPFDYSQWPQFTSAYPGYNQYPGPNYVNQGLGRWPQFDYWNQIANTFPGMSQYG